MKIPIPNLEELQKFFNQYKDIVYHREGGFKVVYKVMKGTKLEALKLAYIPKENITAENSVLFTVYNYAIEFDFFIISRSAWDDRKECFDIRQFIRGAIVIVIEKKNQIAIEFIDAKTKQWKEELDGLKMEVVGFNHFLFLNNYLAGTVEAPNHWRSYLPKHHRSIAEDIEENMFKVEK